MRCWMAVVVLVGCGEGVSEAPFDVLPHEERAVGDETWALAAGHEGCEYASGASRAKAVGEKARVRFAVDGVPGGAVGAQATLVYEAFDADRKKEGWLVANGTRRVRVPYRRANQGRWRVFEVDVTGRVVAGRNRFEFRARNRGIASFKVRRLRLRLSGPGLDCAAPAPEVPLDPPAPSTPRGLVDNRTPAGIASFAALSPEFPVGGVMRILERFTRPYTSVLLDFGPAYNAPGVQMFRADRTPNPRHFDALDSFVQAYVDGTPNATRRKLQLYLVNGPGMRRGPGYGLAWPQGLGAFDRAVQNDRQTRQEIRAYLTELSARLTRWEQVDFRLVVSLEDNLTRAGARAIRQLAEDAGFPGPIGRNPCACGGYGDMARVGDFFEAHGHGRVAVDRLPNGLTRGDVFSNDGWGWTVPHEGRRVTLDDVTAMARKSRQHRVWLNLWYDPIQGYPIPNRGPRDYRFDHRPEDLRRAIIAGLR